MKKEKLQLSERLPLWLCLGWGIGSAGMAAMNLSRALILRFMVAYLGIAAVTAGLLFGVAKLFDAATDPAMGWISDHTHSRMGRCCLMYRTLPASSG